MSLSQFNYLLNALEEAAQAGEPAKYGYGERRRKLLEYVANLERKAQPPEAPAINVESRDFYELCQRYRHSQEWYPHGLTPSQTFEDIKRYVRCGAIPWSESYLERVRAGEAEYESWLSNYTPLL
jgi:hypothetical protein